MEKGIFFKLQLKRAMKIYPTILLITLLTVAAIVVTTALVVIQRSEGEEKQRIDIGIVGDLEDTYLGIGVHVLQNMDNSRFFVNFTPMEEEEAIAALKSRTITGYVHIPDNFVKSIYYGDNIPAQYIMRDGPEGFGTTLSAEVLDVVSNLVIETQNGNYSLSALARAEGKRDGIRTKLNDMTLQYINFIISRSSIYEINLVGVADLLSLPGYFICGIILFFLLIWGISCNKLLSGRNLVLARSLNSRGIKPAYQLLCEYSVFLTITFCTLQIFAVIAGAVTLNNHFGIEELKTATVGSCVMFVFAMLPVMIMITAMHMCFYELVGGNVSGILLQFITAIGLGYISGCFYPNHFFPESVQNFANFLPSGAGFSYLRKLMSDTLSIKDFILPSIYTAVFALVTFAARKRNMEVDRG